MTIPALVLVGGKRPPWFRHSMRALAEVLPNAALRVVEGQTHSVKAKALAPPLDEFFTA